MAADGDEEGAALLAIVADRARGLADVLAAQSRQLTDPQQAALARAADAAQHLADALRVRPPISAKTPQDRDEHD